MRAVMRKVPPLLILTASVCGCAVAMGNDDFAQAQKLLDSQQWQAAQNQFSTLAKQQGDRQDAALYWLAYAQFKNNQSQAALKTISALKKRFPKSRWVDDAKALSVEIKDKTGEVNEIEDDELKLYAINALMNRPSDKAVKLLANIINGDSSPKLVKRAMFVLSQMNNSEAFQLIRSAASNDQQPVQQLEAIRVLGLMGSDKAESVLQAVYQQTTSKDAKYKILRGFMHAGAKDKLLAVAKTEQDEALQTKAIKQLGHLSAPSELLTLYRDGGFSKQRKTIIKSIALGGGMDALLSIIESESDSELKVYAVKRLGLISASKTGDKLTELYSKDSDPEVRKATIDALFIQSNAKALINIIQQEQDQTLKRRALKKLTLIDSDEATEYFTEILGSQG